MEFKKISNNCYYTTFDEETDRCSIGYIKTSNNSALIVDSGASPMHFNDLCRYLEFFNLPLPTSCIITHHHWDHTGGIGQLDMPVYALKKTKELMLTKNSMLISIGKKLNTSDLLDKIYIYNTLSNEESFILKHMENEYKGNFYNVTNNLPNVFVDETEISSLTTYRGTIKFFHSPYSLHSEDSLFVLHVEEKILYVGDGICENMDLDAVHNKKWLETRLPIAQKFIDFISEIDFDICISGHIKPVTKDELIELLYEKFISI